MEPDVVVEAALRVAYAAGRKDALDELSQQIGELATEVNGDALRAAIIALKPNPADRHSTMFYDTEKWQAGSRREPTGREVFVRGVSLGVLQEPPSPQEVSSMQARVDHAVALGNRPRHVKLSLQ